MVEKDLKEEVQVFQNLECKFQSSHDSRPWHVHVQLTVQVGPIPALRLECLVLIVDTQRLDGLSVLRHLLPPRVDYNSEVWDLKNTNANYYLISITVSLISYLT